VTARFDNEALPVFPGYTVEEHFGSGGMGKVYRAIQQSTARQVAIKVLHGEERIDQGALAHEYKILSAIRHPGLVDVYDYGFLEDGRSYLIMEWLQGSPLSPAAFMTHGRFDERAFAGMLLNVATTLAYIHGQHIVHGDIKPDNVFVLHDADGSTRYKMLDFGLSRRVAAVDTGISGTFEYIAPEIIRGEPSDAHSDLYSLGCVAYEMVAGKPPFTGDTPTEILRMHLHTDAPPLHTIAAINPSLSRCIATLLEKSVPKRYRNALQLCDELSEFLGLERTHAEADTRPSLRLVDMPTDMELTKALEVCNDPFAPLRLLKIEAPDGMGKSRLLRSIKTEMQIAGESVTVIACERHSPPFSPVLSLLRVVTLDRANEEHLAWAGVVASMFPDAFADVPSADRSEIDSTGEQLRLFHACASLIGTAAGIDTLIVDDLHHADPFSLEFFSSFAAFLQAHADRRFCFLYSVDPQDVPEKLAPMQEDPAFTTIPLYPFTAQQTKQCIRGMLGEQISESFVALLHRQSGGIPGRLEELLAYCYGEGIIVHTAHGWLVHERENLASIFPASLAESYRRKVERLNREDLLLLTVVAASPVAIPLGAIDFVSDASLPALHQRCSELARQGFVEYRNGLCRASHAMLAEITAELHGDVAPIHTRFLEWYGSQSDRTPDSGTLAHHHLRGPEPSHALPFLLDTAREKQRLFDYPAALVLYQAALPFLQRQGDETFDVLKELGALCNILGRKDEEYEYFEEMLVLAGQSETRDAKLAEVYRRQTEYYISTAEFDRARKASERALGYYTKAKDALGMAFCHHKIGYIEYRTHPGESVIGHYRRALEIYSREQSPIDEGNVLVDIGLVYFSILKDPPKALEHFLLARQTFEACGFHRGLVRAYGNAGAQLFHLGKYDEALESHRQARNYAAGIGDRRLLAMSCGSMGQCAMALSRYSEALLHFEEELRISRELRDLYLQEIVYENLGTLFAFVGEYDRSIESNTRAQELAMLSSNVAGEASTAQDIAGALIEKRDFDTAFKLLNKARAMHDTIDDVNVLTMWWYWYGMLHLAKSPRQNLGEAYQAFTELGELADKHKFRSHQILARSYIALTQMQAGRVKEAVVLSGEAIAILEDGAPLNGGSQDILYHHAIILRASGKFNEARDFIEAAHAQLMTIAESISDVQLYRSFLENVRLNAEIVREHTLLHRTDSKSALSVIREQNLRTLYEVSSKINSVLDLPVLLEHIMDSALEALNAERGLIFLLENDQLVLKVSRNVEKETIKDASEISQSILREVFSAGKPIIIADTSKNDDVRKRQSVMHFRIQSLMCVPIKSKDRILGTVYVDCRSDTLAAMSFSDIEAEFVEAFANLAAMAIENARLHATLQEENLYLKREVQKRFGFENIIGESAPMNKLFAETQAAIASNANVLIYGESGTGKELIAKAIHYNGERRTGHFIAIDCGALPDTLLESELFGYRRGAFTGAFTDKPGLIAEAHNGTLFLDEISNTSLAFQAKLLRVLQEGEYRRVGDTETRSADVRIICATNKTLSEEIALGRFREDLFYRLNVIPIIVPPLRTRSSDIPQLVQHFIAHFNERNGTHWKGASQDFLTILMQQQWRGNVRELENLINRLLAQNQDEMLSSRHIPEEYSGQGSGPLSSPKEIQVQLKSPTRLQSLVEMEREHILYVLQHAKGNKTEAAKILDLKRTTLIEKMKKLGLM
jgi:Nif-specific regulatory protein